MGSDVIHDVSFLVVFPFGAHNSVNDTSLLCILNQVISQNFPCQAHPVATILRLPPLDIFIQTLCRDSGHVIILLWLEWCNHYNHFFRASHAIFVTVTCNCL